MSSAHEHIRFNSKVFPQARRDKRVDEQLKGIYVHFRVEVKRWNPKTGKYGPFQLHYDSKMMNIDDLLTNVGRDLMHNNSFIITTAAAQITYYAICNPATFSPAATDTTLNTEITTPSGLARHQPTGTVDGITESLTHTSSTNTTTAVVGFKNNGASTVTGIKGYGNFNASSAGVLGTESAFTSLDLNVNDILKLTVTITFG